MGKTKGHFMGFGGQNFKSGEYHDLQKITGAGREELFGFRGLTFHDWDIF